MKISDREATKIAEEFLDYVTDEDGNIKEDTIDHAWETMPYANGYYVRLYVDWEFDDPAPEEERRLDTFVEIRCGEDVIAQSSCYGYGKEDIANEIITVYGWV